MTALQEGKQAVLLLFYTLEDGPPDAFYTQQKHYIPTRWKILANEPLHAEWSLLDTFCSGHCPTRLGKRRGWIMPGNQGHRFLCDSSLKTAALTRHGLAEQLCGSVAFIRLSLDLKRTVFP